jgi:hypothetical protein
MAKRLPSSADLDQVIANDNEASGFVQIERKEPINITPVPEAQQAPLSRLKASIGQASDDVIDQATGEIKQPEVAHVPTADA